MCERTASDVCTLAFSVFAPRMGPHASSLRLCQVRGTSFLCQTPNPMMLYSRQGSKTHNHARCVCTHLEYNALEYAQAGWHIDQSPVFNLSRTKDRLRAYHQGVSLDTLCQISTVML